MGRNIAQPNNSLNVPFAPDAMMLPQNIPSPDEERIVYLASDLTEYSVSSVIQQIFFLAKRDATKPIYLVLMSYGGEVHSMFGLYDAIKYVQCPIHTIGLSKIMSASVLILAAGKKGERLIGANTRIMVHSIAGGQFGNIFEQKANFQEMKRMQKQMVKLLAEECNQEIDIIKKIMKKGVDYYISPKKAIKLGIVDKII